MQACLLICENDRLDDMQSKHKNNKLINRIIRRRNMVENDYIMRLIHEMVKAIIKLIFDVDEEEPQLAFSDTTCRDNYNKYIKMADQGMINEAENLIYKNRDLENPECLKEALLFYLYINEFSDARLEEADYSRVEIKDGIVSALQDFGYNGFAGIGMIDELFKQ